MKALLLLLGSSLLSCTGGLTEAQYGRLQECYLLEEAIWSARAERLCPHREVYHDECEHAAQLESELDRAHKKCLETHGR
jgi:hypothetical protein